MTGARGNLVRTLRLIRFGSHLAMGVIIAACVFPFVSVARRRTIRRQWSGKQLAILGVNLRCSGELKPGQLVLANHISWLDVCAITAVCPATFVCKEEVRDWPIIGWLVARCETLFILRGSRQAAGRMNAAIGEALAEGRTVVVFPEGTSSDGTTVLPFHAALVQSAIDGGHEIVALALRYTHTDGSSSTAPAYCGDITLLESVSAIAMSKSLTAEITALAVPRFGPSVRRELADRCRTAIMRHLDDAAKGRESEIPCDLPASRPSVVHPTSTPSRAPAIFLRA